MIEAAVLIVIAGVAFATGRILGSKALTEAVRKGIEETITLEVLEELLRNPLTSEDAKRAIQHYVTGDEEQPLTHGFKIEKGKLVTETEARKNG